LHFSWVAQRAALRLGVCCVRLFDSLFFFFFFFFFFSLLMPDA